MEPISALGYYYDGTDNLDALMSVRALANEMIQVAIETKELREDTSELREKVFRIAQVSEAQQETLGRLADLASGMRASQLEVEQALLAINRDLHLIIENPALDDVLEPGE